MAARKTHDLQDIQRIVLWCLVRHGGTWWRGCGWGWDTDYVMELALRRLAGRGWVTAADGRYTVTDAGRDAQLRYPPPDRFGRATTHV